MSTPGETYNPTEAFHRELEAQENAAVKQLDLTFEQKMAWFQRASSEWGQAAANRIPAVLKSKADQVTDEIKKIEESQMGELDDTKRAFLKETQKTIFGSVQERVLLLVEMAAMQAENLPVGSDKTVSSDSEIAKLREVTTLIERIDVQQLVFDALPADMQGQYLDSVGRKFPADFFPIVKKVSEHAELDENDIQLLVDQVRNLGSSQPSIEQSSVMVVLGIISQKDRTRLLQKMAVEDSFPNFEQVLMGMVATTYVSTLQATEALDARAAHLETKKTTAKRREDKSIDKELEHLSETRREVNSDEMEKTQKAALTLRAEASKYYGSRSYGHKNYAADLLTVRGIGSFLLTANGAATMLANFAMDPLGFPANSMFWLGAAETAAGLEWSNGMGGLVATPTKAVAGLIKGENEEKDDRMVQYTQVVKTELNNNYRESHFYANYAERIVLVYKAKKSKYPDRTAPISLADIGVNKKEDLPPRFQDLWENKDKLEMKISDWAERFSMIDVEAGQKTTEWDTQRKFIEDTRAEVSPKPMEYAPLDFFEYHETPAK